MGEAGEFCVKISEICVSERMNQNEIFGCQIWEKCVIQKVTMSLQWKR